MRVKNEKELATRVNVTFDSFYAGFLGDLAKQEHKPLASLVRDLALEALELREDLALSRLAEKRGNSGKPTLSHEDAWK